MPSVYPPEIKDVFDMHRAKTIGSGGFAKVKTSKHKLTGERVAIKIMDKVKLEKSGDLKRVALEIEALKELNHQNISQLYFVHETATHYYLVLEFAKGGELFDYIIARGKCKENEARAFFRDIVSALAHCHNLGIVHRDLKPENLLLDKHSHIKLIDFGLIARPASLHTDRLSTCCGSNAYAAPELIRGETYIGPAADMWSLGIILYALLCGCLPFDDEDTSRVNELIQNGSYDVPPWMSLDSRLLIGELLRHRPEKRLTIDQLLKHRWILKGTSLDTIDPSSTYLPHDQPEPSVVAEMAKYYGKDVATMKAEILERKYETVTLNYQILLLRHRNGTPMRLPARIPPHRDPAAALPMMRMSKPKSSPHRLSVGKSAADLELEGGSTSAGVGPKAVAPIPPTKRQTPLNLGDPMLQKRESHPPRVARRDDDLPRGSLALQSGRKGYGSHAELDTVGKGLAKSKSIFGSQTELDAVGKRPTKSNSLDSKGLAKSKSLFGSLGSLFGSRENLSQPRKIKALFNVKTTSRQDPDVVKAEVLRVLSDASYVIKEEGYVIKVKKHEEGSKTKVVLKFTFEVCFVDQLEMTGIRLSRIKGDTWAFKKETDALLARIKV